MHAVEESGVTATKRREVRYYFPFHFYHVAPSCCGQPDHLHHFQRTWCVFYFLLEKDICELGLGSGLGLGFRV